MIIEIQKKNIIYYYPKINGNFCYFINFYFVKKCYGMTENPNNVSQHCTACTEHIQNYMWVLFLSILLICLFHIEDWLVWLLFRLAAYKKRKQQVDPIEIKTCRNIVSKGFTYREYSMLQNKIMPHLTQIYQLHIHEVTCIMRLQSMKLLQHVHLLSFRNLLIHSIKAMHKICHGNQQYRLSREATVEKKVIGHHTPLLFIIYWSKSVFIRYISNYQNVCRTYLQ